MICACCHLKCSNDPVSSDIVDHIIETPQDANRTDLYMLVPLTVKIEIDENINQLCCALDIKESNNYHNKNDSLLERFNVNNKNEIDPNEKVGSQLMEREDITESNNNGSQEGYFFGFLN